MDEKCSPIYEEGLNMPKRSAPLASGGRTRGRITIVCNRILPLKLYRAETICKGHSKYNKKKCRNSRRN